MHRLLRRLRWIAIVSVALGLLGCGGNEKDPVEPPPALTYSVGGSVSGLGAGKFLVLSNNDGDTLTVGTNGAFTFPTPLADGATYAVAVVTSPAGQTCTVGSDSGIVNAADVIDVAVVCVTTPVPTYSVGGTVSGLGVGKSVILKNNNTNNLTVSANGAFTFTARLPNAAAYAVGVVTDPVGQHCTVTRASGAINAANVSNVSIVCADSVVPTYSVGGTVSGLADGKTLLLRNNSNGDDLTIDADGAFTFPTELLNAAPYAVSVLAPAPAGQSCTISHPSGNINAADVTNVAVVCITTAPPTYSLGGTVSGLAPTKSLVLRSNGANLNLNANGPFTFPTALLSGTLYNVLVTAPAGQTCSVSGGNGTIGTANITNVSVICTTPPATYSVGGTVTGLGTGKSVVLTNNAGNNLTVSANGAFTFTAKLPNAAHYLVAVPTSGQPTGQTCTVALGDGTISAANVTTVNVTCTNASPLTYSVGGAVSGLGTGKTLVLINNGNSLTVSANGAFTFTTLLANAAHYAVAVDAAGQPAGQTCTVSGGSGNINAANVTSVAVSCAASGAGGLNNFTTTANTLTLTSSEPLKVNAPFFGIEVRKNGADITNDIVNVEALSTTSWRYTFGTQVMNTSGAAISMSLQNRALATPGHYLALGSGQTGTVQKLYQTLLNCQAGTDPCAGRGALPGLEASVKGMSARYTPRDIETRAAGATESVYKFSDVFTDADFLARKGMKLHVIFTMKSFGTNAFGFGDGSNVHFDIPSAWDGVRPREVRVAVKNSAGAYVETNAFEISPDHTQVVLNTAPPNVPAAVPRDDLHANVLVIYSRDPFPEYTWQMHPPVAGAYSAEGGPSTDEAANGGSHGFVYAPWRPTTIAWLGNFMAEFRTQWTTAIANGLPDNAIESISIQETANGLSNTDPAYNVAAYRAGLLEFAKLNAKATRRRAMHGQLFNAFTDGIAEKAMTSLGNDIALWGARLEGPDLFNNSIDLEHISYDQVHRALHDKALTMIWHQHASFSEHVGTSTAWYTPAQQFAKAQRAINDTSTPSGTKGLGADYVFWNTTVKAPHGSPQTWLDALPVIAGNPVIQSSGNDRTLWRRATNSTPIGDQTISKVNP